MVVLKLWKQFHQSHERLKHHVHTAWRYPLPPWGQKLMGFVYFCIPVIGGYHVMQWAISKSHASIGPNGELLAEKKIQGLSGNTRVLETGETELVGTGPLSVKLAVSDERTQEMNKKMLKALFKQERNKRKKQREQQQNEKETHENE